MSISNITFEGHYVPIQVEVSVTHFRFLPDEAMLNLWWPNGGILGAIPLTEQVAAELFDKEYITEDMYTAIMATFVGLKVTPAN